VLGAVKASSLRADRCAASGLDRAFAQLARWQLCRPDLSSTTGRLLEDLRFDLVAFNRAPQSHAQRTRY